MCYIVISFKNLIKDEPRNKGRSVIFKVSPQVKDELNVQKLTKRISKKEKKLEILSKTQLASFKEREKIIKRRSEIERLQKAEKSKIEEEKKEPTLDTLSMELETA